jgi:hypothetical protein
MLMSIAAVMIAHQPSAAAAAAGTDMTSTFTVAAFPIE